MHSPHTTNRITPPVGISPDSADFHKGTFRRGLQGGFRGLAMLAALVTLLTANVWITGGSPASGIVAAPEGLAPAAARSTVQRADWINDVIDIIDDLLDIINGTEGEDDDEDDEDDEDGEDGEEGEKDDGSGTSSSGG